MRLIRSHIHTMGAYYDYRSTKHYHYNQVSLNYENLGKKFDWRVNGYLPVGDKYSSRYQPKFATFQGNSLIISTKREFAMWGINGEVGKSFYQKHNLDCYGAIGPYYFGRSDTNAWGGQARLSAIYKKHIQIDVNGSYDTVFNWIGQGQLSIVFPLGPREKKSSKNWCRDTSLRARASQRVERSEIIVVDHKRKRSVAINPATGLPYTIWFVNNTSNSLGTFESPFPTLVQAQTASSPGDVIYVFPGDGTTTGMNAGITLQNSQRLLGSSTAHPFNTTKGTVNVSALTVGLPNLAGGANAVVALASNNEVSGLSLAGIGIQGIGGGPSYNVDMTNLVVGDCVIFADTQFGISLDHDTNLGSVTIANTIFSGSAAIELAHNINPFSCLISNCNISTTVTGITIGTSSGSATISNCNISTTGGGAGIQANNNNQFDTTITNCNISAVNQGIYLHNGTYGTTITNCIISSTSAPGIEFFNIQLGAATISNCSISTTTGLAGIYFPNNAAGSASISNCTISATGSYGVDFATTPSIGKTFDLSLVGNTITGPPTIFGYNIVNPPANPPSAFQLEIQNNTGTANITNVTIVP